MGKLTALDVQRVDAVDKPATRRRFILIKQSDATAARPAGPAGPAGAAGQDGAGVDVQAVTQAARAVLMAFLGVDLTPEQASALMALAEACGLAELAPKAEVAGTPGEGQGQEQGQGQGQGREVANSETAGTAKTAETAGTAPSRAGAVAVSVERAQEPTGYEELVAVIARAVTEAALAQLGVATAPAPAPGPTETAGASGTVEAARVARAATAATAATAAEPGRAMGTGTGTGTVPVARSAPPPSRQVARSGSGEEPPRLGHGLFADVIFGQ